ncbi:ATP-binding protein [Methanocalculus taiwanensis]|uniref:ATP-binding protein n=1 Tax=Methanocalculus taiwanensis TaxID=106207 RepID=A0ABD4TKD5_9EURY|nr:ATP-binding protein [Methanocalculus taiwanensis]
MFVSRSFQADIDLLPDMTAFLEASLEEAGAGPKESFDLQLSADEIFTNISLYAYQEKVGEVEITISSTEDAITITFTDSGTPFNPLSLPQPDITLGIDERKIGGLGIHLVRELMDTVTYQRRDEKNILFIEKHRESTRK